MLGRMNVRYCEFDFGHEKGDWVDGVKEVKRVKGDNYYLLSFNC